MNVKKTVRIISFFVVLGMVFAGCGYREYDDFQAAEIEIMLDKGYREIDWPESKMAALIPKPKFDFGIVEWETAHSFAVSVAEVSEKEFNEYIAACYQKGFNVNYWKGSGSFYADNEEGYHLIVKTKENNVMYVRLDFPWKL